MKPTDIAVSTTNIGPTHLQSQLCMTIHACNATVFDNKLKQVALGKQISPDARCCTSMYADSLLITYGCYTPQRSYVRSERQASYSRLVVASSCDTWDRPEQCQASVWWISVQTRRLCVDCVALHEQRLTCSARPVSVQTTDLACQPS